MKREITRLFGLVLRIHRTKKELTQSQLAELCEMDWTYISMLERAVRSPSLTALFRLAKALGTTPSALLREVEEKMNEVGR